MNKRNFLCLKSQLLFLLIIDFLILKGPWHLYKTSLFQIGIFGIIDDGSTDGTAHWVKKELLLSGFTQSFISRWKNGPKGVSLARNLGWEKAQSSWVAFLDSDDEWLPHKLEKQWEVSAKYR